jgi:hypothetical protein
MDNVTKFALFDSNSNATLLEMLDSSGLVKDFKVVLEFQNKTFANASIYSVLADGVKKTRLIVDGAKYTLHS